MPDSEWVAVSDPVVLTSVRAALALIDSEYCRMAENQRQGPVPSPFGNTLWHEDVDVYSNGYLTIRPYDWCHDPSPAPNFECADMRVSWYKYLPRGLYVELRDTNAVYETIARVLADSIESMRRDFHDGPGYKEKTN